MAEQNQQDDQQKQSPYMNWASIPGGMDALNTKRLYPAHNEWGIPHLAQAPLSCIPDWLAPYRTRIRSDQDPSDGGVHFFMDDYRFESVWRRPKQTVSAIQKWEVALTPDFSLYYDCPLIMQLWNTYRSRWVGCWWAEHGVQVIPTVSWGLSESYAFCFLGLPERSVLAVSTVGTRNDPSAKIPFLAGFKEMLQGLKPTAVLCYGVPYREMLDLTDLRLYPDYWQSVAAARRKYGQTRDYDQLYKGEADDFEIDI